VNLIEDVDVTISAGSFPNRRGVDRRTADDIKRWTAEAASRITAFDTEQLPSLLAQAWTRARAAHDHVVTFSPKVFIPLTRLCRDVCHYCSFAHTPRPGQKAYLQPDEIRTIASAGRAAGCGEALFTLGEAPEQRYAAARDELAMLGFATTNAYCAAMADMVQRELGLIAHINAGVMDPSDIEMFRRVSGSQGLMLESISDRLCERGQVHFGSPGKAPAIRLAMIEAAGTLRVPFTTGILIGIGETRAERVVSLLAIAALHERHGHIQEVIVQNFLPKPGTRAAAAPAADFDDLLWTTAVARLILPDGVNLQVPPNLSFERFPALLRAGINDWGGISPVTPDHVNPEAQWPARAQLERATADHGLQLVARTPVYPRWLLDDPEWLDPAVAPVVLHLADGAGLLREDAWHPGSAASIPPAMAPALALDSPAVDRMIGRAIAGDRLERTDICHLLEARGGAFDAIVAAADSARATQAGECVTYVVNRNINYTNICTYRCGFCAFSKGKTHDHLRGKPYDLPLDEVARRTAEAWARGATEVCMQGGIHPRFTGRDYLAILSAAKAAAPAIHVHAFSPLEVQHGAQTLGLAIPDYLAILRDAGLGSLPGTAAEILTDRVRRRICPDKLDSQAWLDIIAAAHSVGLRTTSTIMFGHVEHYDDVAQHFLAIRDLQNRTGGITEFVPLPFVHAEAPMFLKAAARRGPTFRETILVHAVARLVLGPLIPNIQASWAKLGEAGIARCLRAGVNDLGGTLMNESISRAAGSDHGQELPPAEIERIARAVGRSAGQRNTLYGPADQAQERRSFGAAPLAPLIMARDAGLTKGLVA
jgi:FO synthase